jgi:uncharacterized membrane protein
MAPLLLTFIFTALTHTPASLGTTLVVLLVLLLLLVVVLLLLLLDRGVTAIAPALASVARLARRECLLLNEFLDELLDAL